MKRIQGSKPDLREQFAGLVDAPRNLLLVKDSVAAILRDEIINGSLQPGDSIVEGKWRKKLGVAQTSIREAINTLVAEGFLEKKPGRTARVISLTSQDVVRIYEVRSVLEGLAARLVTQQESDLSELDQLIADMRSATHCQNIRAFYERDVRFHLWICENSKNQYLEQCIRRLVVPLFAFVVLRLHGEYSSDPSRWERVIKQHEQIVQAIRSADPCFAEQQVRNTIYRFHSETEALIEKGKLTRVQNSFSTEGELRG